MQDRVADPSNSRQLVERIRMGDRGAEAELWRTYSASLLFILKRRIGDPVLAQDALQESFRIALVQLRSGHLDQPEALPGYLRAIALHVQADLGHARRQLHDADAVDQLVADERFGPLHVTDAHQLRRMVGELIAELNVDRDRQLLWRHYVLDHPKELLCRELGLSADHFDRVLHRARGRLRALALQAGLLEGTRGG